MRLKRRAFVNQLNFLTSPGHMGGRGERESLGLPGAGPQLVVTDKCVFQFEEETGEMVLQSLHSGVTQADVEEQVGWELRVADDLAQTLAPSEEELHLLREELDPQGLYR